MKKSDKRSLALWGVLTLLTLCVIYGQSMLPPKESGAFSGFVVSYLKPLLDPFELWDADAFHYFIRKLGHFTEYAFLGIFFGRFTGIIGRIRGKRYISMPMLVVLLVAVSDEFLQLFTGRGSAVADVVLDYSGALCGLLLISLIGYFSCKRSTGKN